jgi:hypothetical protein
MCEPGHFKLCTCGAEELEQLGPDELVWSLVRSDGPILNRMGKAIRPSSQLQGTITSEWFEKQLNQGNCFDFDYMPQQWDWLRIRIANQIEATKSRPAYLSFTFLEGAWTRDRRLGLKHQLHHWGKGKVEFSNGIPPEAVPVPPETVDEMLQRIAAQGAKLTPFTLEKTSLTAPETLAPTDVIWKISRYKVRRMDPKVGEGRTDFMLREQIGPWVDMLPGGIHIEWLGYALQEKDCFGFEFEPKNGDVLWLITQMGTPEASHFAFTKGQTHWYPGIGPIADPRIIFDVIHEGKVIFI